jgi:hypothetical protein
MGGKALIEQDYVTRIESRGELHQCSAFVHAILADAGRVGNTRKNIGQHDQRSLRVVRALGSTKATPQLLASSYRKRAPVDGEQPPTLPAKVAMNTLLPVELGTDVRQEFLEDLGSKPLARPTEGFRTDRLFTAQLDLLFRSLFPHFIEKGLVTAAIALRHHPQHQCDQQGWMKRAATSKGSGAYTKGAGCILLEQLIDLGKDLPEWS